MFRSNPHYASLPGSYLFADIGRKVQAFKTAHPQAQVISLGIGDVSRPLPSAVTAALHEAVDDMGRVETFHGYGPEQGYAFLREAIAEHDYRQRGLHVGSDEIFVSDGSKCDVGNFQELFAEDLTVAVTDPVYPVYVDSNAMSGRAGHFAEGRWSNIVYLPCTADNAFVPDFPTIAPDVIYLCYPNNPTGTVLSRDALQGWVNYARQHGAIILYDAAYEAYISGAHTPHSIYEVEGAREVAVEFRSFSKTAGFTGLRCAFVVVPKDLQCKGQAVNLHAMWQRRQSTKYNGVPYVVQKGAAAVYTMEGRQQVRHLVQGYMDNAASMRNALLGMGLEVYGGEDAPYLWVRTPKDSTSPTGRVLSWDFFQTVLDRAQVVCTPGVGFGPSGEGYVRFTAFGAAEQTKEALRRLAQSL